MTLLDAANGKGPDGLVQIVEQCELLPRRHAPEKLDLELFHFGTGIGVQGDHGFSLAQWTQHRRAGSCNRPLGLLIAPGWPE